MLPDWVALRPCESPTVTVNRWSSAVSDRCARQIDQSWPGLASTAGVSGAWSTNTVTWLMPDCAPDVVPWMSTSNGNAAVTTSAG